MIKTKNMIIAVIVVSLSAGALILLLANSSLPILTVKELKDHPQSESYIGRKIQLIGIVNTYNGTDFYVHDPDDVNNNTLFIYIKALNVEKPTGFEIGKTVLIEGKLVSMSNIWTFKASMISTKCPSKYINDA